MEKPEQLFVRVTHDCSHQREIQIDALDAEARCEGCGQNARLSAENIALIVSRLGHTLMEADRRRSLDGERGTAEWDFHKGDFS